MDYKDIEQLLERYWQCETSVEEESVLRDFFTKGFKDFETELNLGDTITVELFNDAAYVYERGCADRE